MRQKFFRMHSRECNDLQCYINIQCPVNSAWQTYEEALAHDDGDNELEEEEDLCICRPDEPNPLCESCF